MKNIVEMSFEWQNESNGFPADNLDRAKYARFLTDFLVAKGSEKNYVLNVNASWGAGKTWFLRRWSEEIKKNYPVVFVDAWKSDHSKDPFLSVVSAISKDLEPLIDVRFKDSAITKKSWLLLKSIAPEITKGIVKKYLSLDIDEVSKAINNNDASSIAGVGAKAVEKLIKFHDETNSSIDDFKEATSKYLDLIVNKSDKELPLFVFIDELDRCRPTYAIEMLETIKHIFDMENVVFVIATDKDQLQHSIKAVYGSGFNSTKYLDRFFDRSVTLRKTSLFDYISNMISNSNILTDYFSRSDCSWMIPVNNLDQISDRVEWLSAMSQCFYMDLRTTKQWIERLEASILSSGDRIDFIFLSYLLALNSVNGITYANVANTTSIMGADFKGKYISELYRDIVNPDVKLNFSFDCSVLGDKLNIKNSSSYTRNPFKIVNFSLGVHELFFSLHCCVNTIDPQRVIDEQCFSLSQRLMEGGQDTRMIDIGLMQAVIMRNNNGVSFHDYIDIVELAMILE